MSKTKNMNWVLVGIAAAILAAPNATVIKYTVNSVDPYLFNALRFVLIAAITTPFLILKIAHFNSKNLKHALKAGLYMSIAVTSYVLAIKLSHASYVLIITLLTPIFFVLFSAKLTREKITHRAIAGIILAAIGALAIVILPIAISQNGPFNFYPLATLFSLVNGVSFALSIISFKKANDSGLPMLPLMSLTSWIVFGVSAALFYIFGAHRGDITGSHLVFGAIYSGIVVSLISRIMDVVSYEHVGAAITGAIGYLETFIAIIIPLIVLHERLSWEMIVGGILIMLGIYVIQYHKAGKHKLHYLIKAH